MSYRSHRGLRFNCIPKQYGGRRAEHHSHAHAPARSESANLRSGQSLRTAGRRHFCFDIATRTTTSVPTQTAVCFFRSSQRIINCVSSSLTLHLRQDFMIICQKCLPCSLCLVLSHARNNLAEASPSHIWYSVCWMLRALQFGLKLLMVHRYYDMHHGVYEKWILFGIKALYLSAQMLAENASTEKLVKNACFYRWFLKKYDVNHRRLGHGLDHLCFVDWWKALWKVPFEHV